MKKVMGMLLALVLLVGLSGCPLGSRDIAGTWDWVTPQGAVNPNHSYANNAVARNFRDSGRVRKTLVFGSNGSFTYTEQQWLPDREALYQDWRVDDGGAGVEWEWIQTYQAVGTYDTAKYPDADKVQFPNLDTELNVNVTSYIKTYQSESVDRNDDVIDDSEGRVLYEYEEVTVNIANNDPHILRAIIGMNPFDELLVCWDGYRLRDIDLGKDLSFNQTIGPDDVAFVETYTKTSG